MIIISLLIRLTPLQIIVTCVLFSFECGKHFFMVKMLTNLNNNPTCNETEDNTNNLNDDNFYDFEEIDEDKA